MGKKAAKKDSVAGRENQFEEKGKSSKPKGKEKGGEAKAQGKGGKEPQKWAPKKQQLDSGTESDASEDVGRPGTTVTTTPTTSTTVGNTAPVLESPTTTTGKKGKKKRLSENFEWSSLSEQAAKERNERIIQRILSMLLIGFFIADGSKKGSIESSSSTKKKGGGKKSGSDDFGGIASGVRDWKPLLYTLGIFFLIFALKMGEDGYNPYMQRGYDDVNPYEVLGLSTRASGMEIKKAYRALSLTHHPDKNPDCTTCAAQFADITTAYELLGNPEKREAYDNYQRTDTKTFATDHSIALTRQKYESDVLRSNDVWILNLYSSESGMSADQFPIWDDFCATSAHHFKFARIDAQSPEGKKLVPVLPVRKVLFPTIFRMTRDYAVDVAPLYQVGIKQELSKWAYSTLPESLPQLKGDHLVEEWLKEPTTDPTFLGKILIVADRKSEEETKKPQLPAFRRIALQWRDTFEFAQVSPSEAPARLVPKQVSRGATVVYIGRAGEETETKVADFKKPVEMEGMFTKIIHTHAPEIDQLSYKTVCGAPVVSAEHPTRKYCLILVDATVDDVTRVEQELKESKKTYEAEVAELKESDDNFVSEDPFEIQLARVTTAPSLFSRKLPVTSTWGSFIGQTPLASSGARQMHFLYEDATNQGKSVGKLENYKDLYQQLAYEDIKLQDVGPIRPHLPDPMLTILEDVREIFMGSFLRLILSFLLTVIIVATLPELQSNQFFVVTVALPLLLLSAFSTVFLKTMVTMFI